MGLRLKDTAPARGPARQDEGVLLVTAPASGTLAAARLERARSDRYAPEDPKDIATVKAGLKRARQALHRVLDIRRDMRAAERAVLEATEEAGQAFERLGVSWSLAIFQPNPALSELGTRDRDVSQAVEEWFKRALGGASLE